MAQSAPTVWTRGESEAASSLLMTIGGFAEQVRKGQEPAGVVAHLAKQVQAAVEQYDNHAEPSTVMLGVANEHTFLKLLEAVEANPKHEPTFANVFKEKTILQKFIKFRNILGQHEKDLPGDVKENWETDFAGILTMIRNFRNDSGHPSGKQIGREQCYVLLNPFVPCCKKMYQLIECFKQP